MSEAARRATAAYRDRHNLKRVELLVPGDTLSSLDSLAAEMMVSRARLVAALVTEHGAETVVGSRDSVETRIDCQDRELEDHRHTGIERRLAEIEGRVSGMSCVLANIAGKLDQVLGETAMQTTRHSTETAPDDPASSNS